MLKKDSHIAQTFSTPSAILDLHFGTLHCRKNLFGVATSTGSIGIYQLKDERDSHMYREPSMHPRMEHIKTVEYFPDDVLITAFSWHPTDLSVGMTLSTGQVCLGKIDLREDVSCASSVELAAHDLEAWTLAFLPDGSGAYSGGDDSALQFAEVTVNWEYHQDHSVQPENGAPRKMPWMDKKIHGAGVTAILPLHSDEQRGLVLTGSYDDHIRLINAPAAGRRTVLAEMNLGGGVWRLKRLDVQTTSVIPADQVPTEVLLLASCMHAGTRIVSLSQSGKNEWQFEVLAQFEEHKSMNYGSDCQPGLNEKGQRTFVTTSFYDRLLCLWRY